MSKPKVVYFKGEFMPYADATVSVMTHALHYGTGCFEGIRAYWNKSKSEMFVVKLEEHLQRLERSAHVLYMDMGHSVDRLVDVVLELIKQNGYQEDIYIRPLLFMGDETIGVRLHDLEPELTVLTAPMGNYVKLDGLNVCVSTWRRLDDAAVPARAKITGAYINSALAKTEAKLNGFDEAIFLNSDGHVSEGSAMNLFMVREGQLITPDCSQNILEGITRRSIIEIAKRELGLEVEERSVDRSELYVADELFFCGTGAQVAPVISVDRRKVGTGEVGPISAQIRDTYDQAVRGENETYYSWLTPLFNERKKLSLPAMPALSGE